MKEWGGLMRDGGKKEGGERRRRGNDGRKRGNEGRRRGMREGGGGRGGPEEGE
jgi:hypothetical protein